MIETSAVFYTASDGAGYISKMKMQGLLFKTQGEKCQLKYKNSELFFCSVVSQLIMVGFMSFLQSF